MDFQTTHNLSFGIAPWWASKEIFLFNVGTCHGQYGCNKDGYFILSVINDSPGNGHLIDVFEWFENSCRRDNKNLLVLELMNERFYLHLISKKGFIPLGNDNVIKVFNTKDYLETKKNGISQKLTA